MLFVEYITKYGTPMILGPYPDAMAHQQYQKTIKECKRMTRGDALRVELKSDLTVIKFENIIDPSEWEIETPTAARPKHEVKEQ